MKLGREVTLALVIARDILWCMITNELSRSVLALSLEDRLELARRLVESVVQPAALTDAVKEGIRRIEDVASGRVAALSEEEYRAAIQ